MTCVYLIVITLLYIVVTTSYIQKSSFPKAAIVKKESGVSQGFEPEADVVLDVSNLNIAFSHEKQLTPVVRNLSFNLKRGETLAIVG